MPSPADNEPKEIYRWLNIENAGSVVSPSLSSPATEVVVTIAVAAADSSLAIVNETPDSSPVTQDQGGVRQTSVPMKTPISSDADDLNKNHEDRGQVSRRHR
jgi:hypothetical protein